MREREYIGDDYDEDEDELAGDEDEELGDEDEELGDELEEMLEDLGIEGEEAEEIGRRARRGRRRGRGRSRSRGRSRGRRVRRKWGRVAKRRIRGVGGDLSRQLPFLMSRGVGIADGTGTTLTGTCDRRSVLSALYVSGNTALGVAADGIHVTGITVNGRNAVVGAGSVPAALAFGAFAQVAEGDDQWSLGVCDQGGAALIAVTNDSGAAADLYAGFRALTTD